MQRSQFLAVWTAVSSKQLYAVTTHRAAYIHSYTYICNTCTLVFKTQNVFLLPPTYSLALIYFGLEGGWWITCNNPTVLKEKTETERLQPALSVG
jgi:hypothetical protein